MGLNLGALLPERPSDKTTYDVPITFSQCPTIFLLKLKFYTNSFKEVRGESLKIGLQNS